ncbi:uncharacterized protein LOC116345804 isoform X2 [Contarinia nasturtii]|uniref:uncharacterized protein LOC116345804 isoform X2 n=1 Tax=Contarinia nasturtii TaxID=265458 RepID=UPI0012D3CA38|nr:uncharacterized protein LOC116345804 isoform X2 [Contarinia nasturtii]
MTVKMDDLDHERFYALVKKDRVYGMLLKFFNPVKKDLIRIDEDTILKYISSDADDDDDEESDNEKDLDITSITDGNRKKCTGCLYEVTNRYDKRHINKFKYDGGKCCWCSLKTNEKQHLDDFAKVKRCCMCDKEGFKNNTAFDTHRSKCKKRYLSNPQYSRAP